MKFNELIKTKFLNKIDKEETPNTIVNKPIEWLKVEEDLKNVYAQKKKKWNGYVEAMKKSVMTEVSL